MTIPKRLTIERVVPNASLLFSYLDHVARYEFVKKSATNKSVCDVGCGNGYGTYMLAKVAQKIIGVDIADEAISYARKNFVATNLNFRQMDCQNLQFDNLEFDMVVSFDVIEHISNYQSYLSGIHRILKKTGILAISTPNNRDNLHPPENPFHKKEFSSSEFKQLLSKYFNVINLYGEMSDKNLREATTIFKKYYNPVNKYDFLKLRKILPRKVRQSILSLIMKKRGVDISNLTSNNIKFEPNFVECSSTLFCICKNKREADIHQK
jgi:2-polyprenyl-3-methyl-5-hydroxy-6-metoxy-1,4-benzoquinol methylase